MKSSEQNRNQRNTITILLNGIIALDVCVLATTGILFGAGDGQLGTDVIGLGYLKPYTMDSNILAGTMAFLIVLYSIRNRNSAGKPIPKWLMNGYLMGTTCLALTFGVAAAFLAPTEVLSGKSYWIMFSGDMFFFHFVNPMLSVITLTLLLRETPFSRQDRFLGMIPTILYSIVYFVMVVVIKQWDDFYHFTFGGKYYLIPIVIAVIYTVTWLISGGLIRLHNGQ